VRAQKIAARRKSVKEGGYVNSFRFYALGALTVFLVAALGCQESKVDLSINLKPGDERSVVVTETSKEAMKIGANTIRGNANSEIHYGFKAVDVGSGGDVTMEATIGSCSYSESADFGAGSVVPFQNARGRSPIQELMERLVDKKFTFVLSSKGEVKSLSGAAEIRKRLEAEADLKALKGMENFSDSQRKEFVDGFFDGFSEKAFIANMDRIFHVLPPAPVRRGGSWTNAPINNATPESIEQRTLTLESIEANKVTLKSAIAVTAAAGKSKATSAGAGTGSVVLDRFSGLCVRQELNTKLTTTNTEESQFHGETETSTVIELF